MSLALKLLKRCFVFYCSFDIAHRDRQVLTASLDVVRPWREGLLRMLIEENASGAAVGEGASVSELNQGYPT